MHQYVVTQKFRMGETNLSDNRNYSRDEKRCCVLHWWLRSRQTNRPVEIFRMVKKLSGDEVSFLNLLLLLHHRPVWSEMSQVAY